MAFFITFIMLLIFWIFMSGLFDAWHFTLGIISCALVAKISSDFLFTKKDLEGVPIKQMVSLIVRMLLYLPWLFYEIVISNIQIAYLALHPKMYDKIDPHIVKFKTRLKKEWSLMTFGNSITLTPGTITVLIEGDEVYVHTINTSMAEGLPESMENRVGHIFMEN